MAAVLTKFSSENLDLSYQPIFGKEKCCMELMNFRLRLLSRVLVSTLPFTLALIKGVKEVLPKNYYIYINNSSEIARLVWF